MAGAGQEGAACRGEVGAARGAFQERGADGAFQALELLERVGWETCRRAAASVMEPVSTTARRYSSCRRVGGAAIAPLYASPWKRVFDLCLWAS
ncbi:hypothetical protein SMD44_08830 [Streptomyces alboflavus]|uniref:Uncharacterized protein n=1 Tax=Streptomyces alboflavus TaxID=67267 RepID=A0A1Z1WSC3_9ACTN|nr:hypothetical protein SMD44_08830 [Streptomyces alboflavus]